MKRNIIVLALLCTGCGSFQLGYVRATQGQNRELMQSDMLFCKDQAKADAQSGGKGVAEYLLGASIVGFPAGRQMEIDAQRASYKACMEQRGYAYLGTEPPVQQMPASALFHAPN